MKKRKFETVAAVTGAVVIAVLLTGAFHGTSWAQTYKEFTVSQLTAFPARIKEPTRIQLTGYILPFNIEKGSDYGLILMSKNRASSFKETLSMNHSVIFPAVELLAEGPNKDRDLKLYKKFVAECPHGCFGTLKALYIFEENSIYVREVHDLIVEKADLKSDGTPGQKAEPEEFHDIKLQEALTWEFKLDGAVFSLGVDWMAAYDEAAYQKFSQDRYVSG